MYQILHEKYYKLYDVTCDGFIDYFYSIEELIKFIARGYHEYSYVDDNLNWHKEYSNFLIEQCTCDINELFKSSWGQYYRRYVLYDNYDRIINIHDFSDDAFKLWQVWVKSGEITSYTASNFWWRWQHTRCKKHKYAYLMRMNNSYRYRHDPVPRLRKWRGGPSQHSPHTAKIMRMYANPEYKEFNRGSHKIIPQWWDDRWRDPQRSWKEQSKAKHQWQRGKV